MSSTPRPPVAFGDLAPLPHVSRETIGRKRRALAFAAVGLLALAAAACATTQSPQGWSPPLLLKSAAGDQLIIAAHTGHLYALPPNVTTPVWQFPPVDRTTYPIASTSAARLSAEVNALSIPADQKTTLLTKVKNLNAQGPSVTDLKTFLNTTAASPAEKSKFGADVDAATAATRDALSNLQAFYGDLGVSADGKTVYAAAFRGVVLALDAATGHLVWATNVGSEMIGGVAVSGDTVYYGSKGRRVYAADAASGAVKWTVPTNGEVWSTPTVVDGTVYATSLDGTLYALDLSGKTRWTFKNANAGIAGAATVSGAYVYVGAFDNELYAVKVADGTQAWSSRGGNWFWGAPRVDGGVVYAANLDGRVYAVDAASGAPKWPKPFDTGAPVRSSPAVAGGGLIVGNKAGQVYKLDLSTGQAVGSAFLAGSTVYANLTADASGKVYVSPQSAQLIVLDATKALTASSTYTLK